MVAPLGKVSQLCLFNEEGKFIGSQARVPHRQLRRNNWTGVGVGAGGGGGGDSDGGCWKWWVSF